MAGRSFAAPIAAPQSHRQPGLLSPARGGRGTRLTGLARTELLGVQMTVVTEGSLLDSIDTVVRARRSTVFVGLYASLYRTVESDEHYRDLLLRSVTYPDGQGVVSELRRRGVAEAERLATTDVVHPIAARASREGWRVGLYGAAPGTAERAAAALAQSAPGLQVVATWDGYSGGPSVEELRAARLDVLFVALGAPRQEAWAHEVGAAAGVPAILTCGGLLDFLAGDKRRAPGWMQRAGLEWVYRVMLEPRRLFRRYLLGNSYFLWHARADRRRRARGFVVPERVPALPLPLMDPIAEKDAAVLSGRGAA